MMDLPSEITQTDSQGRSVERKKNANQLQTSQLHTFWAGAKFSYWNIKFKSQQKMWLEKTPKNAY